MNSNAADECRSSVHTNRGKDFNIQMWSLKPAFLNRRDFRPSYWDVKYFWNFKIDKIDPLKYVIY